MVEEEIMKIVCFFNYIIAFCGTEQLHENSKRSCDVFVIIVISLSLHRKLISLGFWVSIVAFYVPI